MKRIIPPLFFVLLFNSIALAQFPGSPFINIIEHNGHDTVNYCPPFNSPITLNAEYLSTGVTTTYSVTPIENNMPYPINSAININQDDIFGPIVNLGFDFCFFGVPYDKVVVGANGVITFDLSYANQGCDWSYSASLPNSALFRNCIFGAYHDIHPGTCGDFRYGVVGTYPSRAFIMNFDHVCHFSCSNIESTLQVVLYEGTNVIDVYIDDKPTCNTWNNGNCVIGIQNYNRNIAYYPTSPNRNTGSWTAHNEAWRFTPNSGTNYGITWYKNGTYLTENVSTITDYPTTTTSYVAEISYTNCNLDQYLYRDTFLVRVGDMDLQSSVSDDMVCEGESVVATASGAQSYLWSTGATSNQIVVFPVGDTSVIVTGTDDIGCTLKDTLTFTGAAIPEFSISVSDNSLCAGDSSFVQATGAPQYSWSDGFNGDSKWIKPLNSGDYSITGIDPVSSCSSVETFHIDVSEFPEIEMNASRTKGCIPFYVNFNPEFTQPINSFEWTVSNGQSSNIQNPQFIFDQVGSFDVNLKVDNGTGCASVLFLPSFISAFDYPEAKFSVSSNYVTTDAPLVQFTDESVDAVHWLWDFGNNGSMDNFSTDQNPTHAYKREGTFLAWLYVENEDGCRDSTYQVIQAENNISFYTPASFSPYNKDNLNDIWKPEGIGLLEDVENYHCKIFNRWGQLIFESNDFSQGWDGKVNGTLCEPGIYNFIIDIKFVDALWKKYRGNIYLYN